MPHRRKKVAARKGGAPSSVPHSAFVEALLTQTDLCALYRISRQTLWALRKRSDFPAPFLIGNSLRWSRSEVLADLERRRADRVA